MDWFYSAYPEARVGGFSDVDGTIRFYTRIRGVLKRTDTVVDYGCGRGAHLDDICELRRQVRILRGFVRHVIGIDVSAEGATNPFVDVFIKIVPGTPWAIDDASVDVVISDCVLEHLENPTEFFQEAHRVLRPGGYLFARTPNKWSYPVLAARVIPERFHSAILRKGQPDRKTCDVFPAFYRANSRGELLDYCQQCGFEGVAYTLEGEPAYIRRTSWAYRVAAVLHSMLPSVLRSAIILAARKHC